MADIFLIVVSVVAFCILFVISGYFLVYYSHPDDKNDAYFPKILVVLGFVIAGGTVLGLPLDVANNEGYPGCAGYDTAICGGLNMDIYWNIIFWLIPIWLFVLIPFATFYYEADDGMLMAGTSIGDRAVKKSKLCQALCWEVIILVIFGLIFLITYLLAGETQIPVMEYISSSIDVALSQTLFTSPDVMSIGQNFTPSLIANMTCDSSGQVGDCGLLEQVTTNGTQTITVTISPGTFYGGLMAWMGWFFFAIFGGIGLSALPLDLILSWINRPRHMDAIEFAECKMSLQSRVNELVNIGELIKVERETKATEALNDAGSGGTSFGDWFDGEKRKERREENKTLLEFKQAVFLLEKDIDDFNAVSANYEKYNPLIPYFNLLFGIIAVIISIFWLLHICIYIIPNPPLTGFLNNYFQFFDSWFPLFGVLSVAIFSFYLLLAAVKGCFKVGLRFMLIELHPMKYQRTYMSSFMFNIGLILLCALPVVQFSTIAFSDYAIYTSIYQIFNTQLSNIKFFGWWWSSNIFIYIFLGIAALTLLYLCCKPRDTSTDSTELRDRLRSRRA